MRPPATRRAFLAGAAALAAGAAVPWPRRAVAQTAGGLPIVPRSEWGADLPPTGPLTVEAPGDVRFLLVHHSDTTNSYAPEDVAGILRAIYAYHSGPKGWPDVAYNFFVDRYGGIWEGRTGSIEAPVMGSATGGSQGFALLCCLLGQHSVEPPTEAELGALVALMAWLADRYGVDTTPGATVRFTSRGSNRWPAGTEVEASTISGHRDMSYTACPGDAAYEVVRSTLPSLVSAAREAAAPATTGSPATTTALPTSSPSTTDAPTSSVPATVSSAPSTTRPAPSSTVRHPSSTAVEQAVGRSGGADGQPPFVLAVGAAGVGAAALATAIAIRRRTPGR